MLPVLREHHYTYCIPVISGRNVWVGANVSILPGVTIGDKDREYFYKNRKLDVWE